MLQTAFPTPDRLKYGRIILQSQTCLYNIIVWVKIPDAADMFVLLPFVLWQMKRWEYKIAS